MEISAKFLYIWIFFSEEAVVFRSCKRLSVACVVFWANRVELMNIKIVVSMYRILYCIIMLMQIYSFFLDFLFFRKNLLMLKRFLILLWFADSCKSEKNNYICEIIIEDELSVFWFRLKNIKIWRKLTFPSFSMVIVKKLSISTNQHSEQSLLL